jgi:hypothetical protein
VLFGEVISAPALTLVAENKLSDHERTEVKVGATIYSSSRGSRHLHPATNNAQTLRRVTSVGVASHGKQRGHRSRYRTSGGLRRRIGGRKEWDELGKTGSFSQINPALSSWRRAQAAKSAAGSPVPDMLTETAIALLAKCWTLS